MTTIYISSSTGNDSNPGTSALPWKTLKSYSPNHTYLFMRGDTFYQNIPLLATTDASNPIIIDAYGTGALPIISKYVKLNSVGWVLTSTANVWSFDMSTPANIAGMFQPQSTDWGNVGYLKVDGTIWGGKKTALNLLATQWDFYSDNANTLYVYSVGNPSTHGTSIVCTIGDLIGIHISAYMTVHNVKLNGFGGTGIKGQAVDNVEIKFCTVSEGGGCYKTGTTTRYGDGIAMNDGGNNWTVDSNYVEECYDEALTMQSHTSLARSYINCHFTNNTTNNNQASFNPDIESGTPSSNGFVNCTCNNNTFQNDGFGWSRQWRPKDNEGVTFYANYWNTTQNDLVCEFNTIINPRVALYFLNNTSVANPWFTTQNNDICIDPSLPLRRNCPGCNPNVYPWKLADYAAFTSIEGYEIGSTWSSYSGGVCTPVSGGGTPLLITGYIAEEHTITNKALGIAQANPTDARSYFYDDTLFKYRPYQSVAEVNAYIGNHTNRIGHVSAFLNIGGTLNPDGTFTGGTTHEYWYKDGVNDIDLVEKVFGGVSGPAGGDLTGTYPNPQVVWANGEATYDARYINVGEAAGGDLSGSYPNPSVNWVNGESVYDSRYLSVGATPKPIIAIASSSQFATYNNTNASLIAFNDEADPWTALSANKSNGLYQWNASAGDYAGLTGFWKLIAYTNNVYVVGTTRNAEMHFPVQVWKNYTEGSVSVPPNWFLLHNDNPETPNNTWGASMTGNGYGGAIVFHNDSTNSANRKLRLGLITNTGSYIDGMEIRYSASGNTLINYLPNVPSTNNTLSIGSSSLFFNYGYFTNLQINGTIKDSTGSVGTLGQSLTSNVTGTLWANANATLTATQVGFGNASNFMTGSTNLTWTESTKSLLIAGNAKITSDGIHSMDFVNSAGGNQGFTMNGPLSLNGGFGSLQTSALANLDVRNAGGLANTSGGTFGGLSLLGISGTTYRVGLGNATTGTLSLNVPYAGVIIGSGNAMVTEFTGGTHPLICALAVKATVITDGVATTTDATTLFIEGPATGITPTNPATSMWVKSGRVRIDDNIAASSTVAAGSVTNRYGGATNFLGDPAIWLRININGTDYKIPCYT